VVELSGKMATTSEEAYMPAVVLGEGAEVVMVVVVVAGAAAMMKMRMRRSALLQITLVVETGEHEVEETHLAIACS
jgi:hypothetical protein